MTGAAGVSETGARASLEGDREITLFDAWEAILVAVHAFRAAAEPDTRREAA